MKTIPSWRKGSFIARFGVFLTTAALIVGMAGCDGCSQPPSQNLEIRTWYDLDAVRNNLWGNHTLMNDLDSSTAGYEELASPTANGGKGWRPIGFYTPHGPTAYMGFGGVFDGQGYEMRDLYINRPDEDCVGLFLETNGAVIRNTGVVNVAVIGDECVGALVGTNGGLVSNCYSTGTIVGKLGAGGLVAVNWGTVSNCYSSGNITGTGGFGGLVGVKGPRTTVSNSYSTGNVRGVGAIVGGAGGLVGHYGFTHGGTVTNSFWDTETSGRVTSYGGTGRTTVEMKNVDTFLDAGWNITAVANSRIRNPSYIWNIVHGETYPFLSWQSTT